MTSPAVPDGPGSVWSRFPLDPRSSGDLRAGDPDRELAREILTEAYADGQMDHEEYTRRLDGVLGTHHLGQLVPLLQDLSLRTRRTRPQARAPRPRPSAPPLPTNPTISRWLRHPVVRGAGFVIAVTNLVWLFTSIGSGELIYYWPMWPSLGMVIMVLAVIMFGGECKEQRPRPELE